MRSFNTIVFILTVLAFAGCSGFRVLNVEKEDDFKIGNYKTFNFYDVEVSGDATSRNSRENLELLKASISRQLQGKGLKQATIDPELLVNIGVVVKEKIQTRETTIQDAPRYIGTRNYSWKSEEIEVGRYREGTATVHLVERGTKKMVWKGAVESIVPDKESKLSATIDGAMEALFGELK